MGADKMGLTDEISIHAPVKGATLRIREHGLQIRFISIHAPVKGATQRNGALSEIRENFNPRTREGCDPAPSSRFSGLRLISIHAPVKGATLHIFTVLIGSCDFNPRTREGCDHCI